MRIGINCFLLQAHIGGLKQYFLTLLDELLENDAENEYILFWFEQNREELSKLETERWKDNAILLQDQKQVLQHIDKIDLYFCPFSALYPRPLSLPTVMTLVDIQEMYYPELFTPEDLYNRQLHFKSSTRMADRVITISEYSRQTIIKHHHLSSDKVIVAYLSANRRFFYSDQYSKPLAQQLPDDFIYYPANFWMHKNHDRLLQALCILRDEKNLKINVVFTGFEQANGYPLNEKIIEYNLSSQAIVLGYLSIDEIIYIYQQARMLVFPSLFEGFGIPLVEAMAVGCPIAAANCTSIPEVTGNSAELFFPDSPQSIADSIERVWKDKTLRNELIKRGKKRAFDFSPKNTAQNHLKAFAQAKECFSYKNYLINWFYRYYHRLFLEFRWKRDLKTILRYTFNRKYN
jgi:glycosyltransferase involved in cell wall biosynthesis